VVTTSRLAVALLLNVLFVAFLNWGVAGILLSSAITSGALLLVLLPEYARRLGGRISGRVLRNMLAFGLPFLPVPLGMWIIDFSDRYLLEILASREQVGYYALSYKLAQVVGIAVLAFGAGWAPLRYRIYEREDARTLYRKVTSYYVVATAALVVLVSLLAHETVSLVAPEDYAPAASVVPMLAASYGFYGLFVLMVTGMGVTKRTGPIGWVAVAGATVNVGLNLLLIPHFGMLAAATTTLIANALLAAGAWHFSEQVYPIPLDWGPMAKILLLGSSFVVLDFLFQPTGLAAGLILAVALVASFCALAVLLGAVQRDDLLAGRTWLGELSRRQSGSD
jgi:O-antigen/teichoic acid export membrane protein